MLKNNFKLHISFAGLHLFNLKVLNVTLKKILTSITVPNPQSKMTYESQVFNLICDVCSGSEGHTSLM